MPHLISGKRNALFAEKANDTKAFSLMAIFAIPSRTMAGI
jgi:hypothetical protein